MYGYHGGIITSSKMYLVLYSKQFVYPAYPLPIVSRVKSELLDLYLWVNATRSYLVWKYFNH